jgi:hypothetical protein
MAEHVASMNTALQLLATHEWTNVGFQCGEISFLVLGLVFGGTTAGRALVLSTSAKTSTRTITGWLLFAIHAQVGANFLDASGSATTVNSYCRLTRWAWAKMALLHTTMSTVQVLLAETAAHWDRLRASGTRFPL